MVDRNAGVPEARRLVFRVGIDVGDVIIDGSDILGDGVNVAARLEALCEAAARRPAHRADGVRPDPGQDVADVRRPR
jgi:class 3 adenylate cyclase